MVTSEQAAAAWAARAALGRAIRGARYRKLHPQPPAELHLWPAVVLPRPRPIGRLATLVALLAAMVALVVIVPMTPESASPPPPLTEEPPDTTTPTGVLSLTGGRGRLSGELPPVAASPEPETTPAPTAEPSAEPTAEPEPEATEDPDDTPRPRRTRNPSASPGSGTGGEAGGVPGGTEGGVPGAGGTGGGENLLPDRPPTLASGYDRITFRVVDSRTRRTMTGVCVVIGTADCEPIRPHTNSRGLWWLDLPRGERPQPYDFKFYEEGYFTATLRFTYEPGRSPTVEIRMIRRR